MSTSNAYRQGLKEINRLDPENGAAFIEELKSVSPDFAEYFVEFAFGSIYSRPVLKPKYKELIAKGGPIL
jgi:4-carboxymuconolactone decarboxylase